MVLSDNSGRLDNQIRWLNIRKTADNTSNRHFMTTRHYTTCLLKARWFLTIALSLYNIDLWVWPLSSCFQLLTIMVTQKNAPLQQPKPIRTIPHCVTLHSQYNCSTFKKIDHHYRSTSSLGKEDTVTKVGGFLASWWWWTITNSNKVLHSFHA